MLTVRAAPFWLFNCLPLSGLSPGVRADGRPLAVNQFAGGLPLFGRAAPIVLTIVQGVAVVVGQASLAVALIARKRSPLITRKRSPLVAGAPIGNDLLALPVSGKVALSSRVA